LIPNIITIFRIILVPPFVFLIFQDASGATVAALIIFLIGSFSDWLDGYLARKLNMQNQFGVFLDPLADKLLTGSAFISFTVIRELSIPVIVVIIILIREIALTFLRVYASSKHLLFRTEYSGKLKTAAQMFSIVVILVILVFLRHHGSVEEYYASYPETPWMVWFLTEGVGRYIPVALVTVCALLSVISLIEYLIKNKDLLFIKKP